MVVRRWRSARPGGAGVPLFTSVPAPRRASTSGAIGCATLVLTARILVPAVRSAPRRLVALLACVLALSGCRLEVIGGMTVGRDGSGTVALELVLDADAVARLDELALDPFAELSAAAVGVVGWQVERTTTDDGGLSVRLHTDAPDPEALTGAFRELVADLSADDPALLVDLALTVAEDGAARVVGTAMLRPPASAGARRDGEPVGPAGDELASLVAEAVTARLEIGLPGRVVEHDADQVSGGGPLAGGRQTLYWDVPVGQQRTISARAAAPTPLSPPVVLGLAVGALVLLGLAAWWWRRRRRRRVLSRGA